MKFQLPPKSASRSASRSPSVKVFSYSSSTLLARVSFGFFPSQPPPVEFDQIVYAETV
jgi:hypothetical protein